MNAQDARQAFVTMFQTSGRRIKAEDLKPGDHIAPVVKFKKIVAIEPYDGPFDFICAVARFPDGTGMSLERGRLYETL